MSLVLIRPLSSTPILIFPNLFLGTWSVYVHLLMPSKIPWFNIYPTLWICPVDFSGLPSAHIMVGSSRLSSKETPHGALISPISRLASFFHHKSSLTINPPGLPDVIIGSLSVMPGISHGPHPAQTTIFLPALFVNLLRAEQCPVQNYLLSSTSMEPSSMLTSSKFSFTFAFAFIYLATKTY